MEEKSRLDSPEKPFRSRKWKLVWIVISIFAVSAILFRMPTANMTICKRTTNMATATALESAVHNFYTEYGTMPTSSERVTTNSADGLKLLTILLGLESRSANPVNIRLIKFLAVKEGKSNTNGLMFDANNKVTGLYDSWGSPYTVILDNDNDENLNFEFGGKRIGLTKRRVAVFSAGADHKPGTKDDVTTW